MRKGALENIIINNHAERRVRKSRGTRFVTEQATLGRHGHDDVRRRRLDPYGAPPVRDNVGVGRPKCSENGERTRYFYFDDQTRTNKNAVYGRSTGRQVVFLMYDEPHRDKKEDRVL